MKLLKSLLLMFSAILLTFLLTSCGGNPLQDAVDAINSDEAMHVEMEGLYTLHAETRGDSAIAVIYRAELEELASLEVAQAMISGGVSAEFQNAVSEMKNARITDPKVIVEFLDTNGNLIYSHEFS